MLKTYILCFSNTYTEVQKRADVIWKFQRYILIDDYEQRVFLPPPLSLPLNVYQFFLFIRSRIKEHSKQDRTDQGNSKQGRFHVGSNMSARFLTKSLLVRVTFIIARCTISAITLKNLPNISKKVGVITLKKS